MEVEEGEAVPSPPPPEQSPDDQMSPYETLEESLIAAEEIAAKMFFLKKESRPKSDLPELALQMALLFLNFRKVNRAILIEEDRIKAETEKEKAPVDRTMLQLHNLMYEKNHYLKAIKACKDFRSKHPDIDLVSEDEFFASAPKEIKGDFVSKDEPHDLMLKRLNFELYQRKELLKLYEELEQQKKGLMETIANRKKFLSSLPSHLKSLKKASIPVQQQFGIQHTKKLKQHQYAELLPPALYIIYSQFQAQKEAFGENIELEIIGNVKDAQAFARQLANKDSGVNAHLENGKHDDDPLEEEDEGQRRRKRSKKSANKEIPSESGLYQSHPLNIILHVYDDEDNVRDDDSDVMVDSNTSTSSKMDKLVTLRFEYLSKLNVVCVGIVGSEDGPENNFLCNLFPDDTGLDLPHQSAKLVVGNEVTFDEHRHPRPYKWAQHLAGIDFLPEVPPFVGSGMQTSDSQRDASVISGLSFYRQQKRVRTVVHRLRARRKGQMALVKQIDSLITLKWPSLLYKHVPWAVHSCLCSLQSCVRGVLLANNIQSVSVSPIEQDPDSLDTHENGITENAREDGELPSAVLAASQATDAKRTFSGKGSTYIESSKQLALMPKSLSAAKVGKSLSFSKLEDSDIFLDEDSDMDEVLDAEETVKNELDLNKSRMIGKTWEECGMKVLHLVLSRIVDDRRIDLEAKIQFTMEYPMRPPLFSLSLLTNLAETGNISGLGSTYGSVGVEWFNELRAMEAEVNLHILKMLPREYENEMLAHQVCYLAMMFDFQVDGLTSFSKLTKSSSLIEVGLCKPATGKILARSLRGRDRRRMISWKDKECSSSFPY